MRRLAPAVALIVLSSCAQGTSAPVHSPTPSHSNQTATKTLCRLPVGIGRGQSGFVAYPGGSLTPDPSSDLARSPYHGRNFTFIGPPLGVPSYDWSAPRWLPVSPALVSPDGATYAYLELIYPPVGPTPINGPGPGPIGSRVHVVNVESAADHVLSIAGRFGRPWRTRDGRST